MWRALTTALLLAFGCTAGPLPPAALDTHGGDTCATCRMVISQQRTAAQIVSDTEDPRFFDDIGCLREHLRTHTVTNGGRVYVADHLTREWTPAETAVYARVSSVETPMGSSLLAWSSNASRTKDPLASGGEPVSVREAIERTVGETR